MVLTHVNKIKTCQKCSKILGLYISCFKCGLIYHPNCWRQLPGVHINEKGHAFCCWDITSKRDSSEEELKEKQDSEDVDNSDDDVSEVEEDKYKCEKCNSDFDNQNHLRNHLKKCPSIKKELPKRRVLLKNKKKHKSGKRFNCTHCEFSARSKLSLLKHVRNCCKELPRSYKCTYKNCDCSPEEKESCTCNIICEYVSRRKYYLKLHVLKKHNNNLYKCKHCKYVTHRKQCLVSHVHKYTNKILEMRCTYKNCDCVSEQKRSCKCEPCEFTTKHKCTLRMHAFIEHCNDAKKYKCDNCTYATSRHGDLLRHFNVHLKKTKIRYLKKDKGCNYSTARDKQ